MIRFRNALQMVIVGYTVGTFSPASAYDIAVHAAITGKATGGADGRLDSALKTLGFPDGLNMQLISEAGVRKSAIEWLQEGSRLEDDPETRVLNHFHNPLASTWDDAGLTLLAKWGDSSALWQQKPGQQVGEGSWSWPDARQRYRDAVTFSGRAERETTMAKLLRTLGHIMHLSQDASLPAHTRNDAHPYKTLFNHDFGNPDGYERWVDKLPPVQFATLLNRPMVPPSSAIFARPATLPNKSRTDHPGAPVPVKYLIDTGQYLGTNPDILTGNRIGIAEYSNGNFFSDDTVFADTPALFGQIPFPGRTSVDLGPPELTPDGNLRRYFIKVRHGETTIPDGPDAGRNYRLAVPSALYEYLPDALKANVAGLDGKVFEDYARLLLPRAVGYSAALLDYFFRGELEVNFDSDGLTIVNRTPGESMNGTFEVYYDTKDDLRRFLGSWQLALAPDQSSGVLTVPPIQKSLRPKDPDSFYLVFRGTLGDEADAVVAKRVTREPIKGLWLVATAAQFTNGNPVNSGTMAFPLGSLAGAFLLDAVSYQTASVSTRELFEFLYTIYRNPNDAPATRLTLSANALCIFGVLGPITSIPGDLVEFEVPLDFTELQSYRYDTNPPEIKRVLAPIPIVPWDSPATVRIEDMSGVRFFGVRSSLYPTGYPALGDTNVCAAQAFVTQVE